MITTVIGTWIYYRICVIPLPIVPKLDTWVWLLDDKGVFTVKSCYRRLRGECDTQNILFWRKVWRLQLPNKVINFIWRACNNVLPTATELIKKKVSVLSNCSWCHLYAEDAIHTFFTCYFAREVRQGMSLQGVISVTECDTVLQVLQRVYNTGTREQCMMAGIFCWSLFVRRNKWVRDKRIPQCLGLNPWL